MPSDSRGAASRCPPTSCCSSVASGTPCCDHSFRCCWRRTTRNLRGPDRLSAAPGFQRQEQGSRRAVPASLPFGDAWLSPVCSVIGGASEGDLPNKRKEQTTVLTPRDRRPPPTAP